MALSKCENQRNWFGRAHRHKTCEKRLSILHVKIPTFEIILKKEHGIQSNMAI